MRGVWFMTIGTIGVLSAGAQTMDPLALSLPSEFSISDSPCSFRHNPEVDKVVQIGAVKVEGAKPPETGSVVTVELRNNSAKSITAYVYTLSVTRGGKKNYYGASGRDLIYELALARSTRRAVPPSASFLPGQTHREEISTGRLAGHVEVYPCMAMFDDGTGIGPPEEVQNRLVGRSTEAKILEIVIAELESARDSADPKATLLRRAKGLPELRTTEAGLSGRPMRIIATGPGLELEATARELPESRDLTASRRFLTGRIAAVRALRDALLELSATGRAR